jgi:hypothetical protein
LYGLREEARLLALAIFTGWNKRDPSRQRNSRTQVKAGYFHNSTGPFWTQCSRVLADFGQEAHHIGCMKFSGISAICPNGISPKGKR